MFIPGYKRTPVNHGLVGKVAVRQLTMTGTEHSQMYYVVYYYGAWQDLSRFLHTDGSWQNIAGDGAYWQNRENALEMAKKHCPDGAEVLP